MKSDVTIVTAFLDIGRDKWEGDVNGEQIPTYIKRDVSTYIERFKRLTKLKNKIIVFCEQSVADQLPTNLNITVIPIDKVLDVVYLDIIRRVKIVQQNPEFIDFVNRKFAPEYWSPEYVAINFMKSRFITYCLHEGLIEPQENTAWVDFGYCREDSQVLDGGTFRFDNKGKINFFANGSMPTAVQTMPIFNLIKTGEVLIQGCHMIAPAREFETLWQWMRVSMNNLLNIGLVDDDQTLLLMCYRIFPNNFNLTPNSSTDWFNVIRNNCE